MMGLDPPSRTVLHGPTSQRTSPGAILALLVGLIVAEAAEAADPFYLRLLRQGTDAYNRRDFPTAVRDLRVACFGLLSEPDLLADGLTRLGLAQAATGDDGGFRETFQRLTEVEERFSGYTRANIPKDVRAAFEQTVLQVVPQTTLAENRAFARLVPTKDARVASLAPPQRRKELERLVKAQPRELKWRLMLAELELAEGKPRAAYAAADSAAKLAPGSGDALRLRGLAQAADKKWPQAVDDLKACGAANSDPEVAGSLLASLIELKRWQEAGELAARLPVEVANDPTVRQLSRNAADGLKASGITVVPTPTRAVAAGSTAPIRPPAGTSVTAGAGSAGPFPTLTPKAASKPTTGGALALGSGASPPPPTKPSGQPTAGFAVVGSSNVVPDRKPTKAVVAPEERPDPGRVQELVRADRLDEAFALARKIADASPDLKGPQHIAAELAYRISRWRDAAEYFRRGGDPGEGQPLLLFYEAVSFYETGDRAGASAALKRCLPKIRRTPYVEEYVKKVLGSNAPVSQNP